MMRARTLGVAAPAIWHVDLASSSIYMERIQGHSVKHRILEGTLHGAGTFVMRYICHATLAARWQHADRLPFPH